MFRGFFSFANLNVSSPAAHTWDGCAQMLGARLDVHGDQCKKRTTNLSKMKKWAGQLVVPGYLLGMTSRKPSFYGDYYRPLQELSVKHVFFRGVSRFVSDLDGMARKDGDHSNYRAMCCCCCCCCCCSEDAWFSFNHFGSRSLSKGYVIFILATSITYTCFWLQGLILH